MRWIRRFLGAGGTSRHLGKQAASLAPESLFSQIMLSSSLRKSVTARTEPRNEHGREGLG
eukprot:1946792-Prymnesium_polylepis.1